MAQNQAALRKVKGMSREQEIAYLSTARCVTVGTISQVVKRDGGGFNFKKFYVPKIRGIFVGDTGNYKHETPEKARAAGREILAQWRAEFTGSNTASTGQERDSAHEPGLSNSTHAPAQGA